MGKHSKPVDTQAKADQFDRQHAESAARAEANAPTADQRIEALKAFNSAALKDRDR